MPQKRSLIGSENRVEINPDHEKNKSFCVKIKRVYFSHSESVRVEGCAFTLNLHGGGKMRRGMLFAVVMLVVSLFQLSVGLANKSEVSIEGPTQAAKGSEVTLRITATHNANTASHHSEWLKVMADGKQIARWDFTKENLPEGAAFTKEIKIKVMEDTEIVAEASCNNHGSKGPAKHKIMVK
jgi:desulfoferrodoxin (superoxide reductase-like protein)